MPLGKARQRGQLGGLIEAGASARRQSGNSDNNRQLTVHYLDEFVNKRAGFKVRACASVNV